MATYARVVDGVVQEIILPARDDQGNEIAIDDRYTPEFVASLVDITSITPQPECMWTYDGSTFFKPMPWSLPTA